MRNPKIIRLALGLVTCIFPLQTQSAKPCSNKEIYMKQEIKLTERQKAIKELIQTYEITDQHKLIELLKLKYGIETNQTIISRELHKLGVTKTPVENKLIYELPEEKADPAKEILRLAVTKVAHNESLIVVHTLAGLADFVGDYLDAHGETTSILATLAGENVVFVAPKSIKDIVSTYDEVCKLLLIKQQKD